MNKLFILILVALIIGFTGCKNKAPVSNNETTNASIKKEVIISKEQALDSLVNSDSNEDLRPNKGYSYDGVYDKSGYYKFSWANPGKGTGASFEVDPYTADVYNMGKKVSNLFDSSKNNVNITTKKDIVITFDKLNFNLSKTLDIKQLEFLDSKQLAILRNSIYAQYGYSFTSKEYHEYFSKYSWYSPISSNVESKFNNTDRYNIDLIVNLEKNKSFDVLLENSIKGVWLNKQYLDLIKTSRSVLNATQSKGKFNMLRFEILNKDSKWYVNGTCDYHQGWPGGEIKSIYSDEEKYININCSDVIFKIKPINEKSVNIVFNGREQEFILVESDDIAISNMLFTGEYNSEDGKKYTFFNNAKANFDGYTFNYTINKDAGEPGCDYILDMTNKNDYKRIAYEFKNDLLYLYYTKYTNLLSRNDEPFAILHRTNELTEDFNELSTFWNNFRNSVLNKDLDAIEKLTQFPLETRGPMDYHPIIKFDRDKFKEVFLLFINDNYNKIKDSEELYFKNKEDYDKPLDRTKFKDYIKIILVNNDFAAICSMGFKFKDSRWKLTSLYLSEESYKRLGIDINKK